MSNLSRRLKRRRLATAIINRSREQMSPRTSAHTEVVVTVDDDPITTVYGVGEEAESAAYIAGVVAVAKRADRQVVVSARRHSHGVIRDSNADGCECAAPTIWRNAPAIAAMVQAGMTALPPL